MVRNIDIGAFSTTPQYIFTVWKWIIRLRICAHCSSFYIRCVGIDMTPMWHHCKRCVWILVTCFLVSKIDTWRIVKAPQYKFTVWKCMNVLRICAHCSIIHIICFGINMTSMWHDCIYIYFIYVMWFSPDLLLWLYWLWYFSFSNTYHARIAMVNV